MRFRGLVLAVSVCVTALGGGFALAVAPALAAAPETPEVGQPLALTATTAILRGVLNPGKAGGPFELDPYEFVYRQSGTECKGAGEIVAPAGLSLGGGKEEVFQGVEGLTANTQYTVCLVAHNEAKTETAVSAPLTFTTALPPETPENLEGEPAGTGVKLKGVLNPKAKGNPGIYQFLYRQSTTECTGTGLATPPQAATGATPEIVEGEVTGLLPNTTYTFCLRARNEAGEESALSTPLTLTTFAVAPSIGGESFTNIGSSSATLHANIAPGGAPTTYFFEYGTTTAYGSTTPLVSAGASATPVSVLAHIEGLQPDTPYHFRIVLDSTHGEAKGEDTTFSTLPLAAQGLPDGRGYELVTPPNGHATVVPGRPGVRAATEGNKVTYLSTTPPTGGIGHGEPPPAEINQSIETNSGDNQYLAERSAAGGGWNAANIQPAGINTAIYQSFSSDLSEAIVQSAEPLSTNAPGSKYAGLYAQSTSSSGTYDSFFARTPSHLAFPSQFEVSYAGASGSHQLFEANDTLLEGASLAAEELNVFANEKAVRPLYDSTGGQLLAVDVLPNGHVAPQASYGSAFTGIGLFHFHRLDRVISVDGSRIFWTDTSTEVTAEDPMGVTRLFVRENDASPSASTVQIDASQAPVGSGATEVKERAERSGGGVFMVASSDGSKVYFTDDRKLTADSIEAPGEPDLYVYDFGAPVGQRLTDLTTGVQNVGKEHAHVMGVLGASEDGSYVYFAATGALAPGAKPQECIPTPTALCNVYALHVGESPSFVATVTYFDGEGGVGDFGHAAIPIKGSEEESSGDWVSFMGGRTAQVSSDGRHLVFESIVDLESMDHTRFDGGGSREIYLYDFGSGLSCVSCNRAGVPSLSSELYAMHFELPESFSSTFVLRGLSVGGGRVFFNSKEALVPGDENNRTDVYEWERDGAGSCVRVKGCLFLLSGGTSGEYSALLDASASGDDVFIESRAHLVPRVRGEVYEVYDARVGAPREPAPLVCSGTGCQGVPGAPPIFATPSSVTFNGVGNFPLPPALKTTIKAKAKVVKCKKGFVKKKGRCVKRPRKRSRVKRSAKGRK